MLTLCLGAPRGGATPAEVILLRHAEKPAIGNELNERGRERAAALVRLFTTDPRVGAHGPAAAIFAMKPRGKDGSVRAIQTMEPAAQALKLPLDTRFTRDELGPLAHAILHNPAFDGKTVIVCWEHDALPEILKALGWSRGPDKWPGKSFDRLWVLEFADGKPTRLEDLPQQLLAGDAKR